MDSPSKTLRKVRFTLPEHEQNFVSFIKSRNSPAVQVKKQQTLPAISNDEKSTIVHGTSRYINGTLNFVPNDFIPIVEKNPKVGQKIGGNIVDPKHLRPCIKPPRKSREVKRSTTTTTTVESETNSTTKSLPLSSSLSKKFQLFIRSRSESRGRKKELPDRNRKSSPIYSYATFYFPDNMKTDSMPSKPPRQKQILQKEPDIQTVPTLSTSISLIDSMPMPVRVPDVLPMAISKMNLSDDSIDCESIPQISAKIQQLPYMHQMVNNEQNFHNFTQFFDRWRQLENAANRKRLVIHSNDFKMIDCDDSTQGLIPKKSLAHKKMPDGKSFSLLSSNYRKRIMNIEKTPLVTSLIRACKNADKMELKQVAQSIKEFGISKNDLNCVDKNGRTALSYICVTPETVFLDFLLRLQGIDVNKADNDGNTPLHFAAEAGQSDIITMLITRSRSLVIDAKNIFGITPLMKAAIQGRTDCAKRLMLANASPFEKDLARGLVAREWAKLCGRTFFADALAELIKMRKLTQQTVQAKKEIISRDKIVVYPVPNKSSDSRKDGMSHQLVVDRELLTELTARQFLTAGLASKLRNIIPFYRPKLVSETELPDLVQKVIAKTGETNTIPTVEITPANNHQLINKYKKIYKVEQSVDIVDEVQTDAPKVPLRRKVIE